MQKNKKKNFLLQDNCLENNILHKTNLVIRRNDCGNLKLGVVVTQTGVVLKSAIVMQIYFWT